MGNVKRPRSGAGERLKAELDARGMAVRPFQERLKKKRTPGSAYSSVWSYIKGRVEPPPEFVRAAARELGLREEYLARGVLPKTRDEQRVAELEEGSAAQADYLVNEELQRLLLSSGNRALFHEAWRRFAAGARGGLPDRHLLNAAGTLMHVLLHLSRIWGFRHDADDERELNDFYTAMLHAMMLAMPKPGEGDSVEDAGILWPTLMQPLWAENRADRLRELLEKMPPGVVPVGYDTHPTAND